MTERVVPPDQDGMNRRRATWARTALIAFGAKTGQRIDWEPEDMVSDLIANLAHWCDRNQVSLSDELDRARRNYESETENEGEQFTILQ